MNRRGLILSVLALGVAGFGGATWFATRPGPVAEAEPVAPELADAMIRPYSPILGPADAPVTIVEFFDPACEAWRAFHPIVKDIMAEHGGAVPVPRSGAWRPAPASTPTPNATPGWRRCPTSGSGTT